MAGMPVAWQDVGSCSDLIVLNALRQGWTFIDLPTYRTSGIFGFGFVRSMRLRSASLQDKRPWLVKVLAAVLAAGRHQPHRLCADLLEDASSISTTHLGSVPSHAQQK